MSAPLLLLTASLLFAPPPDTAVHGTALDSAQAAADASAPALQLRPHLDGVGVWIGGSLSSSTLIAKTEDARFGLIGLQFGRILATEGHIAVRYTADLIPAAVLSHPPLPDAGTDDAVAPTTSPIYGMGVAPVGLQFVYRTHRSVQPFFGGTGGLMYFPAPSPTDAGAN